MSVQVNRVGAFGRDIFAGVLGGDGEIPPNPFGGRRWWRPAPDVIGLYVGFCETFQIPVDVIFLHTTAPVLLRGDVAMVHTRDGEAYCGYFSQAERLGCVFLTSQFPEQTILMIKVTDVRDIYKVIGILDLLACARGARPVNV